MQVAPKKSATRAGLTARGYYPFPVEFFDMGKPLFVHLRMHSEYSVNDGIVRLEDAVQRAAQDQMPAVALTDAANLFGMVKFYGAARAAEAAGDRQKARGYFAQLVALAQHADTPRPEIASAQAFLGQR
jgi:hypothetical protein